MYTVLEWSPEVAGEQILETEFLSEAAEAALGCHQAQILSSEWDGYVTTWAEGGAAAKYFAGCDQYGFEGCIPEDAILLVERLSESEE